MYWSLEFRLLFSGIHCPENSTHNLRLSIETFHLGKLFSDLQKGNSPVSGLPKMTLLSFHLNTHHSRCCVGWSVALWWCRLSSPHHAAHQKDIARRQSRPVCGQEAVAQLRPLSLSLSSKRNQVVLFITLSYLDSNNNTEEMRSSFKQKNLKNANYIHLEHTWKAESTVQFCSASWK